MKALGTTLYLATALGWTAARSASPARCPPTLSTRGSRSGSAVRCWRSSACSGRTGARVSGGRIAAPSRDKVAVLAYEERCVECGACQLNCHDEAIFVTKGTGCLVAIIRDDILKLPPREAASA